MYKHLPQKLDNLNLFPGTPVKNQTVVYVWYPSTSITKWEAEIEETTRDSRGKQNTPYHRRSKKHPALKQSGKGEQTNKKLSSDFHMVTIDNSFTHTNTHKQSFLKSVCISNENNFKM